MAAWSDLRWWNSREWETLRNTLDEWAENGDFLPERKDIYRALVLCPLDRVRVIILGQDPYPTPGHADGLAFSTRAKQLPLSLRNVFNEYCTDLGYVYPNTGDLTPWARQGVLLWNTYLTCAPHHPLSHKGYGWEDLTSQVLDAVFDTNPDVVFICWGKESQKLVYEKHYNHPTVINSSHPSPLSAHLGFFGSRPFSRANQVLASMGREEIDWRL